MNLFEYIIQSVYIGRIFKSLTNYSTNTCIPVNLAHVFTEQKDLLRWYATPVDINENTVHYNQNTLSFYFKVIKHGRFIEFIFYAYTVPEDF